MSSPGATAGFEEVSYRLLPCFDVEKGEGKMSSDFKSEDGFVHGLGTRLHYIEQGPPGGYPVILLPGWPQTAYAWRHVAPLIASAGYRVLAFDLPGQGSSDLLREGTSYETRPIADIFHDALRSLGIDEVDLVSHDVGSWVAFAFATRYPGFVRSLTLIETQILGISPMPDLAQAPRAFQYILNGVPGLGEMLTAGHERDLLNFLFRHKLGRQEAINDADVDEYMRTYGDPKRMSAGFEYYRAVPANMDLDEKVSRLTMPVLALGAEKGVGTTLYDAMRPHALDVRGEVFQGYGHYLPEEAPEELARCILNFFRSIETPSTAETRLR